MEKKKFIIEKDHSVMKIHAPYNFVPLSEKVFIPSWADEISHEIPFEDGVSGTIKFIIETKSNLFIRNGVSADTPKESNERHDFSQINGLPFIPGTSIKGMLRTYLKIMSFGKISNVEDSKFKHKVWDPKTKRINKTDYKNSVHKLIPFNHHNNQKDLSDCIFGNSGTIDGGLKGRVLVKNAFVYGQYELDTLREDVLSTPKASFYPTYLRDKGNKLVATYNNTDALIRGYKLYPPKPNHVQINNIGNSNEEIKAKFIPIKAGAIFNGEIVYHNLKPAEIGAILTVLTFYQKEGFIHKIGLAKPLGYGDIEINKVTIESNENKKINDYINVFIKTIEKEIGINWSESIQIYELFAISYSKNLIPLEILSYMTLKEHQNALKNTSETFKAISELIPESTARKIREIVKGENDKPFVYEKQVNRNTKGIHAKVINYVNNYNVVELYIKPVNIQVPMFGYRGNIEPGSIVIVDVKKFENNTIKEVQYYKTFTK